MAFETKINRKINIWCFMTYYIVTSFLGVCLYFGNKLIGSFWNEYNSLTDVHPIMYMLVLPIVISLMFYKVSKGSREDITPIDKKKEEEKYNNKEMKKRRNIKINSLIDE